jgi:hypothetical protein
MGTDENKGSHTVLRTVGSRDCGGKTLSTHSSLAHTGKNAANDLAPTGFGESGACIAFSFLRRNVMGLGGIKIGDYSGKLLDKDFLIFP